MIISNPPAHFSCFQRRKRDSRMGMHCVMRTVRCSIRHHHPAHHRGVASLAWWDFWDRQPEL